jgi:hypothetical protein
MYPGDREAGAEVLSRDWPEARAERFWDADRRVGLAFQSPLGLHGIAWDVYCLYGRGARWDMQSPSPPTFWMIQTGDLRVGRERLLDRAAFSDRVGELLASRT